MKACWTLTMLAALVLAAGCEKAKPPVEPAAPVEIAESAPDKPPAPPPDLTKITVDVKAKTIAIEGRFCLKEGILDYLAVIAGGREYESAIALNCKGQLLHAGLLAIGAEPGPTDEMLDAMKKDPREGVKLPARAGTKLRVTVEWEADGKAMSVDASRLLLDRKEKKPAEDAPWVFTGSYFVKDPDSGKDLYMADVDQALVAVFDAPSAVLNYTRDEGNPYDGMNTGYEVNKDLLPPPGTPCKVILALWQ